MFSLPFQRRGTPASNDPFRPIPIDRIPLPAVNQYLRRNFAIMLDDPSVPRNHSRSVPDGVFIRSKHLFRDVSGEHCGTGDKSARWSVKSVILSSDRSGLRRDRKLGISKSAVVSGNRPPILRLYSSWIRSSSRLTRERRARW